MKNLLTLSLLSFSLIACISATAETSLCKQSKMSFNVPGSYVGMEIPPVSYAVEYDFHTQLSNLKKYGDLSLTTSSFKIANELGDFSWVSHVSVTIESTPSSTDYPSLTLADQDVSSGTSSEVSLNILLTAEETQAYFLQGPVKLTYTLQGQVPAGIKVTGEFCLDASVSADKSISDIGK